MTKLRRLAKARDEAVGLYYAGMTTTDLAKHYGTTQPTIYAFLMGAGVTMRRRGWPKGVKRKFPPACEGSGSGSAPALSEVA